MRTYFNIENYTTPAVLRVSTSQQIASCDRARVIEGQNGNSTHAHENPREPRDLQQRTSGQPLPGAPVEATIAQFQSYMTDGQTVQVSKPESVSHRLRYNNKESTGSHSNPVYPCKEITKCSEVDRSLVLSFWDKGSRK